MGTPKRSIRNTPGKAPKSILKTRTRNNEEESKSNSREEIKMKIIKDLVLPSKTRKIQTRNVKTSKSRPKSGKCFK